MKEKEKKIEVAFGVSLIPYTKVTRFGTIIKDYAISNDIENQVIVDDIVHKNVKRKVEL